jgi:NADH-quinone oxidoreductase subunit J
MIVQSIVFWVLAFVLMASGVMVITMRNPVHSVLFLILAFFNAAGLFLLAGAEFLAMVLVVVYVGAVAVLFLFVVMLLDVDLVRLREGFQRYWPTGVAIGAVMLIEFIVGMFLNWQTGAGAGAALAAKTPDPSVVSNTDALGRLIYTDYVYLFQIAGLILLVAMIGAILLTLRSRGGIRRQNIAHQTQRNRDKSIELRKIPSGGGI